MLIIRRSKLHYTATGIITHIGGRLVHETATYMCDQNLNERIGKTRRSGLGLKMSPTQQTSDQLSGV